MIELHGGTIRVDSLPGAGSDFIVKLPVTQLLQVSGDELHEECSVKKTDLEFSDIYKW